MKRIISIFTAFIIAMFPTFYALAEENFIEEGETVILIFKITKGENIAGVRMTADYDEKLLKAMDFSCPAGGSEGNIKNPGKILWNFIVYSGRSFGDETVAEVTFQCVKECKLEDIEISFDCLEMFDHDIKPVTDDKNSMFEVILKSGDMERRVENKTDLPKDSDTDSDTNTETESDTVESAAPVKESISKDVSVNTANSAVYTTPALSPKTSVQSIIAVDSVETSDKRNVVPLAFITLISIIMAALCSMTKQLK